jgi:hypothetical protein
MTFYVLEILMFNFEVLFALHLKKKIYFKIGNIPAGRDPPPPKKRKILKFHVWRAFWRTRGFLLEPERSL